MKLLVTGGAGFIGSNFIHLIIEKTDHEVINLDKLTYAGNLLNLVSIESSPRYRFVKGDTAGLSTLKKIFGDNKIDAVVNFAAESHVDRSIKNAASFVRTNVLGTQNLLDAAGRAKIKRFVHISTDEVYGSVDENDAPLTENSPLHPNNPYSASKAAADYLCMAAFRTHHLPVIITRCTNNYGPYQFPEKFIPLTIMNLIADRQVPIYGTGQNIRDWIYVTDHCLAILSVLDKGKEGEIYNIAGNSEKHNIAVAKEIAGCLGKDETLLKFVKDRPGHDYRYSISSKKIERELNWGPLNTFKEGLQKTIEWYKQNADWLKSAQTKEFRSYYKKQYGQLK